MPALFNKPAQVHIPIDRRCIRPAVAFVEAFSQRYLLGAKRSERILKATEQILEIIVANNLSKTHQENIELDLELVDGFLQLTVLNRGMPFFGGEEWTKRAIDARTQDGLQKVSEIFDDVQFTNLGRNGQSLRMRINIDRELAADEPEQAESEHPEFEVRDLQPGEETEISRLFCAVYGYNYINDFVYYPEKLRIMRQEGTLISRVAALKS